MAVNRNKLSQPDNNKIRKAIEPLNIREAIWLRNFFEDELQDRFRKISDTNVKNELLAELITNDEARDLLDKSLLGMHAIILPNLNFEWLKNNLRAQIYTLDVLVNDRGFCNYRENYCLNTVMDEVCNCVDNLRYTLGDYRDSPLELDEKADLLIRIKNYWEAMIEAYNYDEWLKSNDEKLIRWTKQYLIDKGVYIDVNIDNSDLKQIREALLASIDLIDDHVEFSIQDDIRDEYSYSPSSLKLLFIDKMKRAWNQKKFRDAGKHKKSHHLPLTQKTKERLDKLAEVKGLTISSMLDIIINSTYEKECLDIDGKELY
jgi:hypothetical protein